MQCSDDKQVTVELSVEKFTQSILQCRSECNQSSAVIAQDFPPLLPLQLSLRSLYKPDQRRRLWIRDNPTGSSSAKMSTRKKEGEAFGTPIRAAVRSNTSHPRLRLSPTLGPKVSVRPAQKVLGLRSKSGHAVTSSLISSFCCVGASSSSLGSSRTASPGPPAGPGRPEPSSPACGAWWTS